MLQNFTKKIYHRNDVICRKIIDSERSKIWRSKIQFDSSKKRPPGGGGLTPPSSNYINAKVRWLWMAMKISLAFSKLVLDVKVKFLLISWHFLVVFWLHPPPPQVILKVFSWYVSRPYLIYVWFVVLKFQMFFIPAEGTILGCFLESFWTSPTERPSNLFEILTGNAMQHSASGMW